MVLTPSFAKPDSGEPTAMRQTPEVISSLSVITKKRIQDVVREHPESIHKEESKTAECTKLDKGNVRAVIGSEVGDDNVADFTVNNYAALMLKQFQRNNGIFPKPQHCRIVFNVELCTKIW